MPGSGTPDAAALLIKASEAKDARVRSSAVWPMGHFPRSDELEEALRARFADDDAHVVNNATVAYRKLTGDLGPYVRNSLRLTISASPEELKKMTPEEQGEHKFMAIVGATGLRELTRQRPLDLANELVDLLNHGEPALRLRALHQLRAMCEVSKQSYRAVTKTKPQQQLRVVAERDADEDVRNWANVVLSLLDKGPPLDAPDRLPPLETLDLPDEGASDKGD